MTDYEAMALFLKVILHNLALKKWCKQRGSSPELQENISYVHAVVCRHYTFWFYFFLWNFCHQLYSWWCSLHKPLHAAINSTAATLSVSLCMNRNSITHYARNSSYRGFISSVESLIKVIHIEILGLSTVTTCPARDSNFKFFSEARCQ